MSPLRCPDCGHRAPTPGAYWHHRATCPGPAARPRWLTRATDPGATMHPRGRLDFRP
jgi:hypothetical protein